MSVSIAAAPVRYLWRHRDAYTRVLRYLMPLQILLAFELAGILSCAAPLAWVWWHRGSAPGQGAVIQGIVDPVPVASLTAGVPDAIARAWATTVAQPGFANLLHGTLSFRHDEATGGRDGKIVIDREIVLGRPYGVRRLGTDTNLAEPRSLTMAPASTPCEYLPVQTLRLHPLGDLASCSPQSQYAILTGFSATAVVILGRWTAVTPGSMTVAAPPDGAVLVSSWSEAKVGKTVGLAIVAAALGLLATACSLGIGTSDLRQARYEADPGRYFVFSSSIGCKNHALAALAAYAIVSASAWLALSSGVARQDQVLTATAIFGSVLALHLARRVEVFYVVDRSENSCLFIDRGPWRTTEIRLDAVPDLAAVRQFNRTGSPSWQLEATVHGRHCILTDPYNDKETMLELWREYMVFIGGPEGTAVEVSAWDADTTDGSTR